MSDTSDWDRLTPEQQKDVNAVRERILRHLNAETEWFYTQHPELCLTWHSVWDVQIRDLIQQSGRRYE